MMSYATSEGCIGSTLQLSTLITAVFCIPPKISAEERFCLKSGRTVCAIRPTGPEYSTKRVDSLYSDLTTCSKWVSNFFRDTLILYLFCASYKHKNNWGALTDMLNKIQSLIRWSSCSRELLAGFLKSLLDDLSYLLDDSMDRIADIKTITDVQSDSASWNALPKEERDAKESFKSGQVCVQCFFFFQIWCSKNSASCFQDTLVLYMLLSTLNANGFPGDLTKHGRNETPSTTLALDMYSSSILFSGIEYHTSH